MDNISQLLYSYIRVERNLVKTGDPSFKKTLGMFRQRLHKAGIRIVSYEAQGDDLVVRVEEGGAERIVRLTGRATE